jgi:hypothetical protein
VIPVDRNDTDRMRLRSIRSRLTYANVASSIALFAALGGTSYALTLPGNSVGAKQLRTGSVGSAEIRTGAVRSAEIRNGAIAAKDLFHAARTWLHGRQGPQGPAGPAGPSFFVEVNSGGGHVIGTANVSHSSTSVYTIGFARSVASCALVASPAVVPGGLRNAALAGSTVVVSHDGDNAVVRTYDEMNREADLPFTLIAAC